MRRVDNWHVVHRMDVKGDVDIGGLFGSDTGSLSSGSIGGSSSADRTPKNSRLLGLTVTGSQSKGTPCCRVLATGCLTRRFRLMHTA